MRNNPYDKFDIDDEGQPISAPESPPAPIDNDRGEPTTKSPKKKNKKVIFLVVGVIIFALMSVGFFGLFFYRAVIKDRLADEEQVAGDPALEARTSAGPELGAFQAKVAQQLAERKRREEEEARRRLAELQAQQQAEQGNKPPPDTGPEPSLGRYAGAGSTTAQPGKRDKKVLTPAELAAQRRLEGDVMWDAGTQGRVANVGGEGATQDVGQYGGKDAAFNAASGGAGGARGGLGGGAGQNNSIGSTLQTEDYPAGFAYVRPDLKFLLINGTTIPCTTIPRMVTNYASDVRCLISRDVYSADGSVLLMGKGSKVRGERKVSIKPGDAKVFVAWGSVETTDGVYIRLDSLGADQLGAAGLDAWIDNHYKERFGGAVMLSALDDVFESLANSTQKDTGRITFENSNDNAQDMASIALENTINIGPTGYVEQARETNIIVARDIDFRSIYGVK